MSKVLVRNIYLEDLFLWLSNHILSSCGDGAGAIVCKNYKEVAEWFLEWTKGPPTSLTTDISRHEFSLIFTDLLHREETEDSINFHDSNENWIFTRNPDISLCDGDYVFIVEAECKSARYNREAKPVA